MNNKVLVAMSGGVDSSVAALLLKQNGYEVAGVTMCLGIRDSAAGKARCCGSDASADARRVCDIIGIRHVVLDFAGAFQTYVLDNFIDEYRKGRTPNPCVRCNQFLKFNLLLQKARGLGFEYIATGHYARIDMVDGFPRLQRPADRRKDQTYFLYAIDRETLGSVLFPLDGLRKEEVRSIAQENRLPVAGKPESQDICFVDETYRSMFGNFDDGGRTGGDIVDTEGNVLGRHAGLWRYTVGQRKGLGIATGEPRYVVAVDFDNNRIVVGGPDDLLAEGLEASNIVMHCDRHDKFHALAQIRYASSPFECIVQRHDDRLKVRFIHPQRSVTPGQSVVLYDGDAVLGGGIIEKAQ